MIRHARAAVLAGAVVCVGVGLGAPPARAAGADWWELDRDGLDGETGHYLADAGSVRAAASGATELRMMLQIEKDGASIGWVDVQLRLDCAGGRRQNLRMTAYGADLTPEPSQGPDDWQPLPAGHPLARFVCQGERDGFQRRPDFQAPVG